MYNVSITSKVFLKVFDMKVKQIVEAKFNHFYLGWGGLQFTDINDNEIKIDINDDQLLASSDRLLEKATSIRKEREPVVEEVDDE